MTDLLEKLEVMGRRGGAIAAFLGVVVLGVAIGLGVWTAVADPGQFGRWGTGSIRFLALLLGAVAVVYAMVGVRLLTRNEYPAPDELFPALPLPEFVDVVRNHGGGICVCTRCRVQVPPTFSTGSCPVCASTVDYFEVRSDEDAQMVVSAVS